MWKKEITRKEREEKKGRSVEKEKERNKRRK
jgi:hypothetical protein